MVILFELKEYESSEVQHLFICWASLVSLHQDILHQDSDLMGTILHNLPQFLLQNVT